MRHGAVLIEGAWRKEIKQFLRDFDLVASLSLLDGVAGGMFNIASLSLSPIDFVQRVG